LNVQIPSAATPAFSAADKRVFIPPSIASAPFPEAKFDEENSVNYRKLV